MLLIFMSVAPIARSQEIRTEICVDFRVNSTVIDSAYMNNTARIQEIIDCLKSIQNDSTINILEISFCGAASPEGSYQLNRKLARGRLEALESLVRSTIDVPDSLITRNDSYIPWDNLKQQVESSNLPRKEEVLSILDEESRLVNYHYKNTHIDSRIAKIRQLDNNRVWQQMNRMFFARMRNACAVFVTYKKELPPVPKPEILPETPNIIPQTEIEYHKELEFVPFTTIVEDTVVVEPVEWTPKMYIKTNLIGLGMGIANLGVETDIAKHWSFALPVYYSAWNYFKSTIKFRTFAFQPEFRWWSDECNKDFFVGAHFGLAYYNFAFDGDYRYQDHMRKTPAVGGGISVGYKVPLSDNERWMMEFALGAGVYPLHYDKFHNTKITEEGLMIDSTKKTYFGIDKVSVSFIYSFDLKNKEGK